MIQALELGAVAAWALGIGAVLVAVWAWLRKGKRRPVVLVALAGGLVAQAAWIFEVATGGLTVVLEGGAGVGGWGGWALGFAGVAAIVSGLRVARAGGPRALADPDRVFDVAIGLLGTGVLLQQIARALA